MLCDMSFLIQTDTKLTCHNKHAAYWSFTGWILNAFYIQFCFLLEILGRFILLLTHGGHVLLTHFSEEHHNSSQFKIILKR